VSVPVDKEGKRKRVKIRKKGPASLWVLASDKRRPSVGIVNIFGEFSFGMHHQKLHKAQTTFFPYNFLFV